MTAVLDLARAVLADTRTWGDRAACIGLADILESDDDAAKQLCGTCPVRNECCAWVMPLHGKRDPGGVRGGLTEDERNTLRALVPAPPSEPEPELQPCDGKRCRHCRQIKPHAEFHQHRHHKDGLASTCKTCTRTYRAERRAQKEEAA